MVEARKGLTNEIERFPTELIALEVKETKSPECLRSGA